MGRSIDSVDDTSASTEQSDRTAFGMAGLNQSATWSSTANFVVMVTTLIAIAMFSGAIGAAAFDKLKPRPQRILVLDMADLLDPIANDPELNAYEKRQISEDLGIALHRAMEAEAANGAIILDASLVLKAPEDSYVKP